MKPPTRAECHDASIGVCTSPIIQGGTPRTTRKEQVRGAPVGNGPLWFVVALEASVAVVADGDLVVLPHAPRRKKQVSYPASLCIGHQLGDIVLATQISIQLQRVIGVQEQLHGTRHVTHRHGPVSQPVPHKRVGVEL